MMECCCKDTNVDMQQLVQAAEDLNEPAQFEYIVQTVSAHLENYLKYNRKERTDLELLLGNNRRAGGPQKRMEVVSLGVLISLHQKNPEFCIQALLELPAPQLDYIK